MKTKCFIYILLLLLFSCNNNKEKELAEAYYSVAKEHYLKNNLDSAEILLDSLHIKFRSVLSVRNMANSLQMQIDKGRHLNSMDSISELINDLKTQRAQSVRLDNYSEIKADLEEQIDSLEKQKKPFWEMYNEIRDQEVRAAACRQCVTRMQRVRNGDNSPTY